MSMLSEFRKFAVKGNVIDMAVGIIIGAAFGKIVSSLVNDVIMPPIGQLIKNVNFSNLFITLGEGSFTTVAEAKAAGVATLNYGMFVNEVINFVIIAFAVFLLVKAVNAAKQKEEEKAAAAPPPTAASAPSGEEKLLAEIRDLLKSRS